jgi:hypothetical protein
MAERGLHVTGVDSSPTLISLCRQRLPDHEWLVGDMRSLHLPRQFDGTAFFISRPMTNVECSISSPDTLRLRPCSCSIADEITVKNSVNIEAPASITPRTAQLPRLRGHRSRSRRLENWGWPHRLAHTRSRRSDSAEFLNFRSFGPRTLFG